MNYLLNNCISFMNYLLYFYCLYIKLLIFIKEMLFNIFYYYLFTICQQISFQVQGHMTKT